MRNSTTQYQGDSHILPAAAIAKPAKITAQYPANANSTTPSNCNPRKAHRPELITTNLTFLHLQIPLSKHLVVEIVRPLTLTRQAKPDHIEQEGFSEAVVPSEHVQMLREPEFAIRHRPDVLVLETDQHFRSSIT